MEPIQKAKTAAGGLGCRWLPLEIDEIGLSHASSSPLFSIHTATPAGKVCEGRKGGGGGGILLWPVTAPLIRYMVEVPVHAAAAAAPPLWRGCTEHTVGTVLKMFGGAGVVGDGACLLVSVMFVAGTAAAAHHENAS